MKILLDTSVWIDYFKGGKYSSKVDRLIEMNVIATCGMVLAELLPFLEHQKEKKVISLLKKIPFLEYTLDWDKLMTDQIICLGEGVNKVGIPDLIIVETIKQNDATLCSLDKHFYLMYSILGFDIYDLT